MAKSLEKERRGASTLPHAQTPDRHEELSINSQKAYERRPTPVKPEEVLEEQYMDPNYNQAVFQAKSKQNIEKNEREAHLKYEAQECEKEEMRKSSKQEASDHQMIDLPERLHYAQGRGVVTVEVEQQSLPVRSLPAKQQHDKEESPESDTTVATLLVCESDNQSKNIYKLTMCQDSPIDLKLRLRLMLIKLLRPHLCLRQTLLHGVQIPRNKPNLKVPRNRHQRRLELVVIDIIRIRRFALTSDDFVRTQDAD